MRPTLKALRRAQEAKIFITEVTEFSENDENVNSFTFEQFFSWMVAKELWVPPSEPEEVEEEDPEESSDAVPASIALSPLGGSASNDGDDT